MSFGELLKALRERAGLKKADLARRLSVTLPYITNVEKGKQKPPTLDRIEQISDALSLPKADKERLLQAAAEERIPQKEKNLLQRSGSAGVRESRDDYRLQKIQKVPVLRWEDAGQFVEAPSPVAPRLAEEYIHTAAGGAHLFALRVQDDAMEPEFREDELIIIKQRISIKDGDYVISADRQQNSFIFRQFKQYGSKKILHPLNPKYPDLEFTRNDRYIIVGKIAEKIKKY
jgi:SOS-response transcriptional repressor LexA